MRSIAGLEAHSPPAGVAGKVFVCGNALKRLRQQAGEPGLAQLDRQPAQAFAVDFEQIEGAEHGGVVTPGPDYFDYREPAVVAESLSSRHQRTGSAATAATSSGKRLLKSWPLRAKRRTPWASRRAVMRKPSCVISWSQSGPGGEALAGDGRQVR